MRNRNRLLWQARRIVFYGSSIVLCSVLLALGCRREQSTSKNAATSSSNDQKSGTPETATSDFNKQDIEELEKFSPEDLLKELRARESEARSMELPDSVLARQDEAKVYQPELRTAKLNPLLTRFTTEAVVHVLVRQQKVIYGQDNRKDVFAISSDPQLRRSADAVVSLFEVNRVVELEDGKNSKIVRKTYGTEYGLCTTEPFFTEPCSAFCSGVLVAPDIVATAGHCVDTPETKTPPVTEIKFVFGYRMRNDGQAELVISTSEIYTGTKIIGKVYTSNGPDWALLKLDRKVKGHEPVNIRRSSKIQDAEDVYVIGHPCGLPAKFADGATVRSNSNGDYFVANLDTYGGNSGSPVFNRTTHEVEGLLVRGERDFAAQSSSNSCFVSLACPNTGCRGEDCVRTALFAHMIPQN